MKILDYAKTLSEFSTEIKKRPYKQLTVTNMSTGYTRELYCKWFEGRWYPLHTLTRIFANWPADALVWSTEDGLRVVHKKGYALFYSVTKIMKEF